MNKGSIRSSIESRDDSWIIRITDDDNDQINIECKDVQEYSKQIAIVGEAYDEIEVIWSKDMYLKPKHFEEVHAQMANFKESDNS